MAFFYFAIIVLSIISSFANAGRFGGDSVGTSSYAAGNSNINYVGRFHFDQEGNGMYYDQIFVWDFLPFSSFE
jgi:hypothetical protein